MDCLLQILNEELDALIDQYKIKDTVGYVVVYPEDRYFWDVDSKSLDNSKNLPYDIDDNLKDAVEFAKIANPFNTFQEAMIFLKNIEKEIKSDKYYEESWDLKKLGVYATIQRDFSALFIKKMEV